MASTPTYTSTPLVGGAVLTAANSGTRGAPASGATIATPTANGGQIERITIGYNGTLAADTTVIIYRVIAGTYYMLKEVTVPAKTIVAGAATDTIKLEAVDNPDMFPIAMPNGATLYAVLSVAAANGIVVQAEGGNY